MPEKALVAPATPHWRLNSVQSKLRRSVLSLRGMTAAQAVIVVWVVATRMFMLDITKLGFRIGRVPLFFTDWVLLALLGLTLTCQPSKLLFWGSCGSGAGPIGRAVWLLYVLSLVYFGCAVPVYGILAMRDLAIFGYSLFFPLTYWSLSDRVHAVRLARYFIYSGLVVATVAVIDKLVGSVFLLGRGIHSVFNWGTIETIGGGDFGGICAFSLAGLFAYALFDRKHRWLHGMCAFVSFLALAAATTRSAAVGVVAATLYTAAVAGRRYRIAAVLVAGCFAGLVLLGSQLPTDFPTAGFFRSFYLAIASAVGGTHTDPNAAFRIARWSYEFRLWRENPLFGVGYGIRILPFWAAPWEFRQGMFNAGMPHNTFLFVMVRMGLVGIGLIGCAWWLGLARLTRSFLHSRDADELAVANVLVVMLLFASFVLFFERPVNGPAFWIMLATGARLARPAPVRTMRSPALAYASRSRPTAMSMVEPVLD